MYVFQSQSWEAAPEEESQGSMWRALEVEAYPAKCFFSPIICLPSCNLHVSSSKPIASIPLDLQHPGILPWGGCALEPKCSSPQCLAASPLPFVFTTWFCDILPLIFSFYFLPFHPVSLHKALPKVYLLWVTDCFQTLTITFVFDTNLETVGLQERHTSSQTHRNQDGSWRCRFTGLLKVWG